MNFTAVKRGFSSTCHCVIVTNCYNVPTPRGFHHSTIRNFHVGLKLCILQIYYGHIFYIIYFKQCKELSEFVSIFVLR